MATVPPKVQKAADVYADFMREIKTRIGAIKTCLDYVAQNPKAKHGYLQAEFGFLQLRYICDLIALAALVVHHPYGRVPEELLESWHARRLLQDLSDKYPDSFPRPVKREGANEIAFIENPEALTLKKLQRIFDKCGKVLHRGRLDHILKNHARVYNMAALDRWASQVWELLSNHALMLPDHGVVFVVSLYGGLNGDVIVVVAAGPGPFVYRPPEAATPSGHRARKPRRQPAAIRSRKKK